MASTSPGHYLNPLTVTVVVPRLKEAKPQPGPNPAPTWTYDPLATNPSTRTSLYELQMSLPSWWIRSKYWESHVL